jgi:hypothetical protein
VCGARLDLFDGGRLSRGHAKSDHGVLNPFEGDKPMDVIAIEHQIRHTAVHDFVHQEPLSHFDDERADAA